MLASITDILSVIIIFQLLFLFIFLMTYPKGKKQSNILLAFFFFSLCANFTDGVLILKNAYANNPSFAFIGNNFSLLFGPLLYLYTRSIIYRDSSLNARMSVHAIPFIIVLLFSIISYHAQSFEMKQYILESANQQKYPAVIYLLSVGIYTQFYMYAFVSLRNIRNYRNTILHRFSEVHKINLDWLISTILLFMVVIAISFINSFASLLPSKNLADITLVLIIVALFFYINRLLFKALGHPEIFKGISVTDEVNVTGSLSNQFLGTTNEKPMAAVATKYAGSTLTDQEKETIKENLRLHMQMKKPYLDPELNLEQLALQLNIKPKILSQVINECLHQNFFDFVNRYRIDDAKRLLTDPADKKITVLEVLYEVGFNSKSSFNTLFKKYTGITPSEFKKQNISL